MQADEVGKGLLWPIDGIGRRALWALRGDEGSRGHRCLGFGCFEVALGIDHTGESAADDALSFVCVCLIKVLAEVRCGVIVEGADVPSAIVSPAGGVDRGILTEATDNVRALRVMSTSISDKAAQEGRRTLPELADAVPRPVRGPSLLRLSVAGARMGGMMKTGADYAWFENDFPDLSEAYCFTLVRGPSPTEVMSRLGGRPEPPLHGIAPVVDAAFAQFDLAEGDRQLVAMTAVGAWSC